MYNFPKRFITLILPLTAMTQLMANPVEHLRDSIPEKWQYASEFSMTTPDDDHWWKQLNDPVLDSLIAIGINNNFDVYSAMNRVTSARAMLDAARAGYYPTVSVNAGWNKARTSGRMAGNKGVATNSSYFSAGASVSWEIDLFGRITAQANQKKAAWNASKADYDAMMVTVGSEIATSYIQLRTWQSQLAVANDHIKSQKRVVDIAVARHEAGLASALDVAQAKTVYFSTVATIPGLEQSIHTAINTIATLLGIYAHDLPSAVFVQAPLPDFHAVISTGIPADLLRRRPDVVAAEYQMAEASAAVGVAKKEFLPALTINGSISTAAHDVDDLFSGQSFGYTVAPTLTWTLFNGFARRADVADAKAQLEVAWSNYNSTVMNAITEVDNAMSDYITSLQSIESLEDVITESKTSLTLSTDLYKSGNSSFTNVADAQMNFLQYTNSLITAHGDALTALITLYKSLGGGWN